MHQHRQSIDAGVVSVADTSGATQFVIAGGSQEEAAVFSPDGKWIA